MSKGDALDIVLEKIDDKKYWEDLKEVCQCNNLDINDYTRQGLVKFFNIKIRNSYNKFVMILKNDVYYPDYSEILVDLAEIMGVSVPKHAITFYDVCRIEEEIVVTILRKIRNVIIENKGYVAWDSIEKKAQENFERLYMDKKITEAEYMSRQNKINTTILENILNGPTGSFGIYMLVKELYSWKDRVRGSLDDVIVLSDPCPPLPTDTLRKLSSFFFETGKDILMNRKEKVIGTVLVIYALRKIQDIEHRI